MLETDNDITTAFPSQEPNKTVFRKDLVRSKLLCVCSIYSLSCYTWMNPQTVFDSHYRVDPLINR